MPFVPPSTISTVFVPLARSTPFGLVLPKTTKAPTNNISNSLTNGGCLRNWSILSSMLGHAATNCSHNRSPQRSDTAARPNKCKIENGKWKMLTSLLLFHFSIFHFPFSSHLQLKARLATFRFNQLASR